MTLEVVVYLIAPVVGIIYSICEHCGVWDKLTGREAAINGLRRLRSGGGYPESWVYNRDSDRTHFKALLRRINKIASKNPKDPLGNGLRQEAGEPALITPGGDPLAIKGLPCDWPQKSKCFYSDNYPVLLVFGALKGDGAVKNGKAFRACTLKDIDDCIKRERENRRFLVGTLMVGIIAIASIITRLVIRKGP